jgi:hypothetical protein
MIGLSETSAKALHVALSSVMAPHRSPVCSTESRLRSSRVRAPDLRRVRQPRGAPDPTEAARSACYVHARKLANDGPFRRNTARDRSSPAMAHQAFWVSSKGRHRRLPIHEENCMHQSASRGRCGTLIESSDFYRSRPRGDHSCERFGAAANGVRGTACIQKIPA